MFLVLSCAFLAWGICRLIRIVESFSVLLVNKVMIILHIVAYLLIIAMNVLTSVITAVYYRTHAFSVRNFEISASC